MDAKRNTDRFLLAVFKLLCESPNPLTIEAVARKINVTWPTARFYLMKLAAEGKVDVEELSPRGMIFRAKKTPVEAVITGEGKN